MKTEIKEELNEHGIAHSTIEIEYNGEKCSEENFHMNEIKSNSYHH